MLELQIPGEPENRIISLRESGIQYPVTRIILLRKSGIKYKTEPGYIGQEGDLYQPKVNLVNLE